MPDATAASTKALSCAACGSPILRMSRNDPIPKWCPDCPRLRANERKVGYRAGAAAAQVGMKLWAACEECLTRFERKRKGPVPKRCPACALRRHRQRTRDRHRAKSDQAPFPCASCGTIIMPSRTKGRRLRCKPCAVLKRREQMEDWYRRNPDKLADKWRTHKQRRRAAKRTGEYERFSFREICERDEWNCGICGHQIDRLVKYPDRRSASLDHVIPLSKGGPHTRANVRLACLGCNVDRGNRMESEDY